MKTNKTSKRKMQAEETKSKIFESAHKLFEEHGFDNVSIDSIVKLAGVSKGSFYVHFDSKYSIISFIIRDYVTRVDTDYKLFLEALPDNATVSEILILLAGKITDTISQMVGHDHMKILYEAQLTKAINTNALLDYNRKLYSILEGLIARGITEGEFKADLSVKTITNHCIMSLRGLTYEWLIRYPDFDLKEQVLKHYEILLSGIKKT